MPYANSRYEVDAENVCFASYDGALYTKDLTELIRVPPYKREITLADKLEKIDTNAFLYSSVDQIVVPWGVTTIEDYGVEFLRRDLDGLSENVYVILPDTLKSVGAADRYTMCRFIYSDNNAAINLYKLYPSRSGEIEMKGSQWRNEYLKALGKTSLYDFYGITPNSFKTFNGKTYYFDTDCKMVTGTKTIGDIDYTFDENGVLQSQTAATVKNGLIYQDGKAYYYENGVMLKSRWVYTEGNWYYLNDYGAGVVNCWRLKDGKYCYLDRYGRMKTKSWVLDYGNWYYVSTDGSRYESRWAEINGIWYWFGGSGKMAQSQWLKLGGKWYYFTDSGAMAANKWVKSGAYWYYLGSDGAMLTNTTTPDGYKVDAQGRWK
jgi:glucan-binding YG repeat protein